MAEIKFVAWVPKDIPLGKIGSIPGIWHNCRAAEDNESEWSSWHWPPYQVEITVQKVEVDNG